MNYILPALLILFLILVLVLLIVGILATVRVVVPAAWQTLGRWWQAREWKPREALKSQLFTIANKLGSTPTE